MKAFHLLLFLLCPLLTFGQINFLYNGFRSGDEIIKQQVDYKDPGRDGENVIWDFGKLKSVNDEYSLIYSSPILQKDSYSVMGYDTIQSKNIDQNSLIIGTEHNTMYYYQLKNNQLVILGHENPTTFLRYTEPLLVHSFPMNYNDSCQSNFKSQGIYSAKIPFSTNGIVNIKSDAYGVMILPSGDTIHHVIRLKTIQTLEERIPNVNNQENLNLQTTIETYKWYSKGYRYPIFETIRTINNRDSLTLSKFETSFFFPPQEHLYLDNDKENLAVLDSLWNLKHNISIDNPVTNPENQIKLSYNFYPNPVESQLTLEYYLEEASSVSVNLYSMNGKLVKSQSSIKLNKGLHTGYIDCSNLSNGTYILIINTNNTHTSDKIIKR